MFCQQSFSHNLVSFRRAYQCYCQPCKKGTFFLKRALFFITLKVGGHVPPVPPPLLTPLIEAQNNNDLPIEAQNNSDLPIEAQNNNDLPIEAQKTMICPLWWSHLRHETMIIYQFPLNPLRKKMKTKFCI